MYKGGREGGDGLLGRGKGKTEEEGCEVVWREGGSQLSAGTHHMQTGSRVSVCLCAREGRRWPAGEEEREGV